MRLWPFYGTIIIQKGTVFGPSCLKVIEITWFLQLMLHKLCCTALDFELSMRHNSECQSQSLLMFNHYSSLRSIHVTTMTLVQHSGPRFQKFLIANQNENSFASSQSSRLGDTIIWRSNSYQLLWSIKFNLQLPRSFAIYLKVRIT